MVVRHPLVKRCMVLGLEHLAPGPCQADGRPTRGARSVDVPQHRCTCTARSDAVVECYRAPLKGSCGPVTHIHDWFFWRSCSCAGVATGKRIKKYWPNFLDHKIIREDRCLVRPVDTTNARGLSESLGQWHFAEGKNRISEPTVAMVCSGRWLSVTPRAMPEVSQQCIAIDLAAVRPGLVAHPLRELFHRHQRHICMHMLIWSCAHIV